MNFTTKRSLLNACIALSISSAVTQAYAETVVVQAEQFNNSGGTFNDGQPNPVTIYSVNGQEGINWINNGDFVDYNIDTNGGEYTVVYSVGTSIAANANIELFVNVNGSWVSQGTVAVPLGSWDDFQPLTHSRTVTLPAGSSTVRIQATGGNWQWNLESFSLTSEDDDTTPVDVADITVNLENFTSTGKIGATVAGDSVNGFNPTSSGINFNTSGDYADYSVTFAEAGTYSATLAAGTPVTGEIGAQILINNSVVASSLLSATSGWDNYVDFDLNGDIVINSPGTYTIRLQSYGSSTWQWNGDTLAFSYESDQTGGSSDADNDGVNDGIDQCPSTPAGTTVDANGCAVVVVVDTDNDGVNDGIDQCPNTPAGTTVDANGCAVVVVVDTDNDGVNDGVDQCPNTPAGTTVDANGCAIVVVVDTDNDGVNDGIDQCPNTPAGTTVDANGCAVVVEVDTDNDGVNDNLDQCPNTPAGSTVDANGCVNDGGGVATSGGGLLYGEVSGAMNETAVNPNWLVTTSILETEDKISGNTTEIYTGFINDADGNISFYENSDDSVRLYIDGNLVLSDDSWENSKSTANLNLSPGIHAFELRLGNADGGSGPVSGIGFGVDVDGGTNFVHPSTLSSNIFTYNGTVTGDPRIPPEGGIIVELEDFVSTGTTGRVGGDTIEGFAKTATGVNWVTNGDYADYNVTFEESGTYRAFFSYAQEPAGSYGARIDLNGEPVAWGYFAESGSWDAVEVELYGGNFIVETAGTYTMRIEAIGGSDWQWSGDNVRIVRVDDVTTPPARLYNPNEHTVPAIEVPSAGLKYLKAPVSIPAANQVLKSDVWYTYPQNSELEGFEDFRATGSFWGHPPEESFYDESVISEWVSLVQGYENVGLKYTARGEFDWGFRWVTEYLTNPQPHLVETLDDRVVRMTFMGYFSHEGYNNNWLSNHSPAFVPFFKSQVDQILKSNPSRLMFDTQTNSTRSTDMNTFGGDFNEYAMANFREWLDKKYSSSELAAMGINNISTFNYKQLLLDSGVTHDSFRQAADTLSGSVPLLEDFIYFNRDVWNQRFAEVLDYIRVLRPDIEIGASTHLFESRGYLFNENITFLAGELNLGARTSISEIPTNIAVHLKGAEAVDKTLAYFPYPWEFAALRDNSAPRFGRGWVAQSYAMGGLFSIPADVWVGGEGTWSPGADNYRDVYHFVRDQATLLDNYTSYAKAGLVHAMYSSMRAGFIDGGAVLQSSVRTLIHRNINFDLMVFGDEGYPVVPRASDFDKYDVIFVDGDRNYLTPAQAAVLNAYNGKIATVGDSVSYQAANISVKVAGAAADETVSALSRVHETNTDAPYVVHLINRPFAGGVTPTLNGVEVAIPSGYFPEGITTATLHLPGGTSTNLTITTNGNGDKVVTVNNLEVWGMIELAH